MKHPIDYARFNGSKVHTKVVDKSIEYGHCQQKHQLDCRLYGYVARVKLNIKKNALRMK